MNTVETTQKRFVCENPKCQKEHDGLYGSGRFCSKHCRMVWIGMKSNQTMKEHGTKKCNFKNTDKKRAPYGTWKCQYCELVFETRAKLGEHKHLNHKEKCGKISFSLE